MKKKPLPGDSQMTPHLRIALDPGINRTGWAARDAQGKRHSGVLRMPLGESVAYRCWILATQLETLITYLTRVGHLQPMSDVGITLYCEVPAAFSYARSTNRHGKGVNQKSLAILNRAIGAIYAACHGVDVAVVEVVEVTPQQWKGRRAKGWDKLIAEQELKRKVTKDEADARALLAWAENHRGKANA